MSNNEVMGKVKKVISEVLKVDVTTVKDDANFIFDLGAVSMQSIALVAGFEEEFAAYCGVKHAVAVGNGFDALLLILRARGIGPAAGLGRPSRGVSRWCWVHDTAAAGRPRAGRTGRPAKLRRRRRGRRDTRVGDR